MTKENNISALIVDLTGVLFLIHQRRALQLLGLKNVLIYMLTHFKNPFKQVLILTDVIAKREQHNSLPLLFYKGYQQPSCVAASHLGLISSEQAQIQLAHQVRALIKEGYIKSKLEKNIMKRFADILVDTKTKTSIMRPNYALIRIIKHMQHTGKATSYILSNLDIGTYAYLRAQYPNIFSLFQDAVISAEVGMMKPSPEIYTYILKTNNLSPEACLFIDDQQENITSAQELGIKSVLYTNARSLKKLLASLDLIG